MATQYGINQDLYHKYNGMLEKQSEMNGYLKGVVESNESIGTIDKLRFNLP